MLRSPFKISAVALLLLPKMAGAQTPAGGGSASVNVALLSLLSVIAVLVLANALIANVLRQLAYALSDKFKSTPIVATATPPATPVQPDATPSNPVQSYPTLSNAEGMPPTGVSGPAGKGLALLAGGLLLAGSAQAREEAAVSVSPHISGMLCTDFYFLIGIIGFLMILLLSQMMMVRMLTRELRGIPVKAPIPARIFQKNYLDIFNKSVALENEGSIVMDHDYDGIRELDNDLPPWWKWGFILTIVVSVVYLGYYHLGYGPLQMEEYNIAVKEAEEEKAAYLAKSGEKIDETNLALILDAGELSSAKVLFNNVCAACHREDGGGAVGPNLTDDYWIHGGTLVAVFKTIKYGWKDKGMPAWEANLSAKQMASIASYVKTLHNTKPPDGKPSQGDLFVEGGDGAQDSVGLNTEPRLLPIGEKQNKDNPLLPLIPE
jgi:cytochrome c oxidase cbb3-type subunit 3